MTIETRGARPSELPLIRQIVDAAFNGNETQLNDHLIANDPALTPESIRIALKDGEPVAATYVLPRQLRTARGWTPGAVLTLVACRPDVQGQGYGGATVRDALAWMATQGLAVAILYGHRNYYPRFGFIPVLPHCETILAPGAGTEPLQNATPADLGWMTDLYTETYSANPCAVARTAAPWLWALRAPHRHALLTLPDHQGYAFIGRGDERLGVAEAAAASPAAAERLLAGLRAAAGGKPVRFSGPPDNLVVQAALRAGAEQRITPPGPGMVAFTDPHLTIADLGAGYPHWALAPYWHA